MVLVLFRFCFILVFIGVVLWWDVLLGWLLCVWLC